MASFINILRQNSLKILILLFFFIFPHTTFSQIKYNIVNTQGIRTIHNSEVLNNISYLPLSQISPVLFPAGQYDESKGEIKLKNGLLKITPLSFYIVFDKGISVKAAQMNTPAIIIKSELYVPAVSFFKSLETIELFAVAQKNETFYFNIKGDSNQVTELFEPETISGKKQFENDLIDEKLPIKFNKIQNVNFKKFFNESSDRLKKGLLAIKNLNEKEISGKRVYELQIPDSKQNLKEYNDKSLNPPMKKSVREDKPVFKGKVKPIEKKYPPNLYVLPQNLIRKELEEGIENDSLKKNDLNEIKSLKTDYDLFASTSMFSMFALPQFIKITSELVDDTLIIHLFADGFIESYQAPECAGKNLTLRIKNAVNSIDDYKNLNGIERVNSEVKNDLLIYRIKTEYNLISCSSKRNGSKEIIYSLLLNKPKDVVNNKTDVESTSTEDVKPVGTGFENEKKKWALDVIVLDPGHGGHDPGAISINGYKEKDFTLEIGLKVRDLLKENMPDTKVIMTRDDDTFIELYQRRQIANKNKGKLFLSIHLNSAPTKPSASNGFETYILRPGRNDDAVRVANFENSVIKLEKKHEKYKTLTEEELIIATMAQSAFVKFSELFAKILQSEVENTTPMKNRGVNQAGFYVLVGASMPNVLFEVAFLSNQENEDYVNSKKGIDAIAKGIYNAIARYADDYERLCK
ncbi:MAG: N-acetylmuramoyl-L-alanine amidase [Bacteroidetes bacterium]|nr:MAG: N-acetylmuramoyl-L-alanine amidase [Bacteroidota bacterium]